MNGVFITGTDTGVGKTVVATGLMKLLQTQYDAIYWKPVQTNAIMGDDTTDVKNIGDISDKNIEPSMYRFPEPLSPYMAAKKWGKKIEIDPLSQKVTDLIAKKHFVVIEGAGGLLVPFNEKQLQIDFIKKINLPLIIVSEDRVGAINQCLLTLDEARHHNITILGIVLTNARGIFGNSECIKEFGKVEILAELPPTENKKTLVTEIALNPKIRMLFNVSKVPV